MTPPGGSLTYLVLIWMNLPVILIPCQANSPPKLISQEGGGLHRVLPAGSVAQLTCPVEADSESHLFFDWYKDKEPLTTVGGPRFRVLPSGSLRIKDTGAEDTGLYVCRAVNGFGSVEVNTTLIILDNPGEDEDEGANDPDNLQNRNLFQGHNNDGEEKGQMSAKPRLVHVTKFHRNTMQRPLGSSIRFRCVASGYPTPQITWLKNDHEIHDSSGRAKRGRWSLHLQDVTASDSGNYTCVAHNPYGTTNHSFPIEVVDRIRRKPEMTGDHPLNTTALYGETATFQCSVHSDIPPHVQWVKQVDSSPQEPDVNIINVEGESFRVMQPSEVVENPGGHFVAKLVIPHTQERDAGKYICLCANTLGYSYRAAYLTVLNRPPGSQTTPFPIVLTAVIVTAVALALLVFLCFYLRKQHSASRARQPMRMVVMETKEPFLNLSSENERQEVSMMGNRKTLRPAVLSTPTT